MPPSIPDAILGDPVLAAALVVVVRLLVAYQRGLSYTEYRAAHLVKCYVFAVLDPFASRYGRPLVRRKGPPEQSADYVRTLPSNPRAVAAAIRGPFTGHLVATAKRRPGQWAHSQWRQRHGDGTQTEVYLFSTGDGGTDVYAHVEAVVEDPDAHLNGDQEPGDARGAFASAWEGRER